MKHFIEKHHHFLSIICPIIIGIIFVVLCCLNLSSSTWFDESYTSYITRGNFGDIWHLTSLDVHPPLYYFALRVWSLIFGHSMFALRFMSVFFGLIAIIIAFHLIKRHFGIKPAIVATFFMGISPILIRYGQEMRMYTMVLAIVLGATYVLSLALEAQTRTPKKALKYWLVYAVLICAGMWTHYFSALAWLTHVIYILYYFNVFQKGGLKSLWQNQLTRRNLLITYLIAVILYLPWIPLFLSQSSSVQNGFWVGETSANTLLGYFTETLVYSESAYITNWALVLVIFTVAMAIFLIHRTFSKASQSDRRRYFLLFALTIIPPILLVLLSLPPLRPLFVSRYVAYSAIILWLCFGLTLATVRTRKLTLIISTFALLGLSIFGIVNVTNREPSGYVSTSFAEIYAMSSEGEPILVTTDWNYYDGIAYTSDAHPVYFYKDWCAYQWGSLEPIRQYHLNVFDSFDDFQPESFWVFYNTGEDLPSELTDKNGPYSSYRTVTTISDEHHTAIKLQKT